MATQQCPTCGEWIDDDVADYCPGCGEAVGPADPAVVTVAPAG